MAKQGDLRVDGKVFDPEDMTFREQQQMRALVKDMVGDPEVDFDTLTLAELLPAMVTVFMRRDDPAYELDAALDLKMRDVYVDEDDAPVKKAPPTSRGSAKKSTRAASGSPA
jgi:hypothetical protein